MSRRGSLTPLAPLNAPSQDENKNNEMDDFTPDPALVIDRVDGKQKKLTTNDSVFQNELHFFSHGTGAEETGNRAFQDHLYDFLDWDDSGSMGSEEFEVGYHLFMKAHAEGSGMYHRRRGKRSGRVSPNTRAQQEVKAKEVYEDELKRTKHKLTNEAGKFEVELTIQIFDRFLARMAKEKTGWNDDSINQAIRRINNMYFKTTDSESVRKHTGCADICKNVLKEIVINCLWFMFFPFFATASLFRKTSGEHVVLIIFFIFMMILHYMPLLCICLYHMYVYGQDGHHRIGFLEVYLPFFFMLIFEATARATHYLGTYVYQPTAAERFNRVLIDVFREKIKINYYPPENNEREGGGSDKDSDSEATLLKRLTTQERAEARNRFPTNTRMSNIQKNLEYSDVMDQAQMPYPKTRIFIVGAICSLVHIVIPGSFREIVLGETTDFLGNTNIENFLVLCHILLTFLMLGMVVVALQFIIEFYSRLAHHLTNVGAILDSHTARVRGLKCYLSLTENFRNMHFWLMLREKIKQSDWDILPSIQAFSGIVFLFDMGLLLAFILRLIFTHGLEVPEKAGSMTDIFNVIVMYDTFLLSVLIIVLLAMVMMCNMAAKAHLETLRRLKFRLSRDNAESLYQMEEQAKYNGRRSACEVTENATFARVKNIGSSQQQSSLGILLDEVIKNLRDFDQPIRLAGLRVDDSLLFKVVGNVLVGLGSMVARSLAKPG